MKIKKLIYDNKMEYLKPYVKYISKRFAGLEKIPIQDTPFHSSFSQRIDFHILTFLHLRIGIIIRQSETELIQSDFADFDYVLLNESIKVDFKDEKIIYWQSKEDLVEQIRFFENKKKKEIQKATEETVLQCYCIYI